MAAAAATAAACPVGTPASSLVVVVDLRYPTLDAEVFAYMRGTVSTVLRPLLLRVLALGRTAVSVCLHDGIGAEQQQQQQDQHSHEEGDASTRTCSIIQLPGAPSASVPALLDVMARLQTHDGVPSTNAGGDDNVAALLNSIALHTGACGLPTKLLVLSCARWWHPTARQSPRVVEQLARLSRQGCYTFHVVLNTEAPTDAMVVADYRVAVQGATNAKLLAGKLADHLSLMLAHPSRGYALKLPGGLPLLHLRGCAAAVRVAEEVSVCACHGAPVIAHGTAGHSIMTCAGAGKRKTLAVTNTYHALKFGLCGALVGRVSVEKAAPPPERALLDVVQRIPLDCLPLGALSGTPLLLTAAQDVTEADALSGTPAHASELSRRLAADGMGLVAQPTVDLHTFAPCALPQLVLVMGEAAGGSLLCYRLATIDVLAPPAGAVAVPIAGTVPPAVRESVADALAATPLHEQYSHDLSGEVWAAVARAVATQREAGGDLQRVSAGGAGRRGGSSVHGDTNHAPTALNAPGHHACGTRVKIHRMPTSGAPTARAIDGDAGSGNPSLSRPTASCGGGTLPLHKKITSASVSFTGDTARTQSVHAMSGTDGRNTVAVPGADVGTGADGGATYEPASPNPTAGAGGGRGYCGVVAAALAGEGGRQPPQSLPKCGAGAARNAGAPGGGVKPGAGRGRRAFKLFAEQQQQQQQEPSAPRGTARPSGSRAAFAAPPPQSQQLRAQQLHKAASAFGAATAGVPRPVPFEPAPAPRDGTSLKGGCSGGTSEPASKFLTRIPLANVTPHANAMQSSAGGVGAQQGGGSMGFTPAGRVLQQQQQQHGTTSVASTSPLRPVPFVPPASATAAAPVRGGSVRR